MMFVREVGKAWHFRAIKPPLDARGAVVTGCGVWLADTAGYVRRRELEHTDRPSGLLCRRKGCRERFR